MARIAPAKTNNIRVETQFEISENGEELKSSRPILSNEGDPRFDEGKSSSFSYENSPDPKFSEPKGDVERLGTWDTEEKMADVEWLEPQNALK